MLKVIKKSLNSQKLFKAVIFIMIIAVFLVNAKFALAAAPAESTGNALTYAGAALGPLGNALSLVLGVIAYILTAVIGLLITVVVAILIQVAQFGNIINVPTVIQGWVIVRDLCNMSFILILLVIAFATILRQENFSVKKLLPKLLIMAVLINFSRTLFGLMIDVSQIIMLTFVNAFASGGGWFIEAFRVNTWYQFNGLSGDGSVTSWSTSISIIAGVLAAIITLIIVSVMLAVLVARIVMLWIYTIFSPLIFMGFAIPAIQKYTGKLWEDFTKQLVVGPVLAFFIWLALTTASGSSDLMTGTQQGLTTATEVCVGAGAFFCQGNFQKFIIVIGLLMGGLMVAQTMGGAAGSIAGGALSKIKSAGALVGSAPSAIAKFGLLKAGRVADSAQMWGQGKIAKGLSKITGGLYGEKYQAKSLNYRMIKSGWDKNQAVKMRDYEGTKAGAWQDQFNRTLSASVGIPVYSQIKRKDAERQIKSNEGEIVKTQELINNSKEQLKIEIDVSKKDTISKEIEANEGKIAGFKKDNRKLAGVTATWGKLPIQKYARLEEQQKANEEYSNIKKEDLNEEGLVHNYNTEGREDKKRAYLMHLADINGINTLFDSRGEDMNFDNIKKLFAEFGDAAGDVAAEVSRRAEVAGNYKMMGFHRFDVTQGKNRLAEKSEQFEYAMRKDNERFAQNHGRTTHFDSLVDRHTDGTVSLSELGVEQLLHIANNKGRTEEIGKGNYQVRYGEMVIKIKQDIINKAEKFRQNGDNIKAESLLEVLRKFEEGYGVSSNKLEENNEILLGETEKLGKKVDKQGKKTNKKGKSSPKPTVEEGSSGDDD